MIAMAGSRTRVNCLEGAMLTAIPPTLDINTTKFNVYMLKIMQDCIGMTFALN